MKNKLIKAFLSFLILFLLLFFGRWYLLFQFSQNESPAGFPTETVAVTYANAASAPVRDRFYGYEDGVVFGNDVEKDLSFNRGVAKSAASLFASAPHNYAREGATKGNLGAFKKPAPQAPNLPPPQTQGETYEKIGSLGTWTRDFDNDEKKVRTILESNKVLIQQEDNSGLKGHRLLTLALGVVPEKFDPVIEEMKKVGTLLSFSVTKTDKTNDYRALMAQRASIEKNRDDLIALKKRSGKLAELLDLQEKIFQIDRTLEDLGLQIGQFEGQTSLCTVQATLLEIGPAVAFWVFAVPAYHWALSETFSLFFYALFSGFTILAFLWAIEKAKTFPRLFLSKLPSASKK